MGKPAQGTSAQVIKLFVDTGTSNKWFNSAKPSFCSQRNNECADYGTLEPEKSLSSHAISKGTLHNTVSTKSSASGDFDKDTLDIGDQDMKGVQLALATKNLVGYGTLAIGYAANIFEALPGKDAYQNLPQIMVDQGLIKINAYSMYLNSRNATAGSILYGGVDTARYDGDFTTLSVQKLNGKYQQFIVALDRITFPGLESKPYSAILDCGHTNNYLPSDIATIIWRSLGAVQSQDGNPVVECSFTDSELTVDFEFGSTNIRVPLSQLVYTNHGRIPSLPKGTCDFGIWAQEDGKPVILGDPFLRNAYVVYDLDNNEISIAPARFTEKSKIVELDRNGVKRLQVLNANKSTRDLSRTKISELDDSRSEEENSGDSEEDSGPSIQLKEVKVKAFGLNIHIGGDEEEDSSNSANSANDPSYGANHVHRSDVNRHPITADLSDVRSRNPTSNSQLLRGSESGSGEEYGEVHDDKIDTVRSQSGEEPRTRKESEPSARNSNTGDSESDEEEGGDEEGGDVEGGDEEGGDEEGGEEEGGEEEEGEEEEEGGEEEDEEEETPNTTESSSGNVEEDAPTPGDSSYQNPSTGDTKQNQVVDLDNAKSASPNPAAEPKDGSSSITQPLAPGLPSKVQPKEEHSPPQNNTANLPTPTSQTTHPTQTPAPTTPQVRHNVHPIPSPHGNKLSPAPPPSAIHTATPAYQIHAFKAPPANAARAVFLPRRASRNARRRRRGFGD